MNLFLILDDHFSKTADGRVFSEAYNHQFFLHRYLRVFDQVFVVARVSDRKDLTEPPVESVEGPGVTVIALPDWRGSLGFVLNRLKIVNIAARAVSERSAVIIKTGGIGTVAFGYFRKVRYPIAFEVISCPWDTFGPDAVTHPLRPLLRRWLFNEQRRQCSGASAVSYVTDSFLQKRYPCPTISIGISDVSLPPSAFVGAPRTYESSVAKTIICVGYMNEYKGQDVLLDALGICGREGVHLNLVLVGHGKLRERLENQAGALGIRHQVRFAGWIPSKTAVHRELDTADLFVLPSRAGEGMPRALVEAMARALPCVATAVGGTPEVLPADAIVPPRDPRALADKLVACGRDLSWLSEMLRRNLSKAAEFRDGTLEPRRIGFYKHVSAAVEEWRCRN